MVQKDTRPYPFLRRLKRSSRRRGRVSSGSRVLASRTITATGIRIRELCNRLLAAKEGLVDTGELSIRTFHDDHAGCLEIADHFDRDRLLDDCRPEDFEAFRVKASIGRGLHAFGRMVTLKTLLLVRSIIRDRSVGHSPNATRFATKVAVTL